MQKHLFKALTALCTVALCSVTSTAQISLQQDYNNNHSAPIGIFQNISFREGGFSGLYAIPGTQGKEFWVCSDRGVNIDAANANPAACRPTYDKIFCFPAYAPKIHRIRLAGDSIQILQSITMKRPDGTTATGVLNPTGFGSTAAEQASTDTVQDCANFSAKSTGKDTWSLDAEGIVVDKDGFFWVCDENGPVVWKMDANGKVVKRFTPYGDLPGAQPIDVPVDTVFRYRKNNRGFEGIALTPNGRIYAIIQSPLLFPSKNVGENTRVHRILEIDPATNTTRMFAYLNDGIIGGAGANQIRLRDWKIGDMAAVNDSTFLVLEAALRGTTDIKRMYLINISSASVITQASYSGQTLEALVDSAGLASKGLTAVTKTLFMDLLANGWPGSLEKAEGLAILNDSTIFIGNDNDYGQMSPLENGVATATGFTSHVFKYTLQGAHKLSGYQYNEEKTAVCHNGTVIFVKGNAVAAHLAHGDLLGICNTNLRLAATEASEGYTLYPNPAHGIVTLSANLDGEGTLSVTITDMEGKVAARIPSVKAVKGRQEIDLNISELTAGMYLVNITYGVRSKVLKLAVGY